MHQPTEAIVGMAELDALIDENHALVDENDALRAKVYDLEGRPEEVYRQLLKVKKRLFLICKKMLHFASRFSKKLGKNSEVQEFYDGLLDIYTEVRCDDKKH